MRVAVAELTGNLTYVLVRIGQQIFGQLHFLLQNVLFQRNTRDGCKQMGQVLLVVAEVRGDLGDLDVLVAAPFDVVENIVVQLGLLKRFTGVVLFEEQLVVELAKDDGRHVII